MGLDALALRFRRARGPQRQQLKWFAYAGLILVAVPIADTISPLGFSSSRLIELLTTWPLYAAIGIAILRHRLYDIDRLLNRTLVYGPPGSGGSRLPPWSRATSNWHLDAATVAGTAHSLVRGCYPTEIRYRRSEVKQWPNRWRGR